MPAQREQVRGTNVRLRAAILDSGLTIEEVAHRSGVDPKTLERWIAGRAPHPRNRHALAEVLNVSTADLWPDHDPSLSYRLASIDLVGVEAVYPTRSDFLSAMPPETLFAGATSITSAGLSNNLLSQHYADQRLERLLLDGTTVSCLFLDPASKATANREDEEGYDRGHLAGLTALNISLLQRLRARLPESARDRLSLATYDQTIRFHVIIVAAPAVTTAVVQPYLPHARGVDSPTLVIRRNPYPGLFETFNQVLKDLSNVANPC
jgi:transcriptional regulator with XRE-family HTH domain